MRRSVFLLCLVSFGCAPPRDPLSFEVPKFATPHGYTRESANHKFTFVMLTPPGVDQSNLPRSYQAQSEDLAKKYPTSGMYRAGETTPVWTYSGPYAYEVYLANDGIHFVVVEGESWFTSQYISGQKLPSDVELSQLDSAAVTFYRNGEKIRSHSVREIVGNPAELRNSPQYVQWRAGEAIAEKTERFVMYTQDAKKVTFDLKTGEMLTKVPAGADAKYFFAIVGGITVVTVLLVLRWLIRSPVSAANRGESLAAPGPAL